MKEESPLTQGADGGGGVQNAEARFVLPSAMTVETAEALAAELKQLPLVEKTNLTLDASQVEAITTPGLQLVVSLEKALSAQGGTLTVGGGREAFLRAFQDAGLGSVIGKSPR